MLTRTVRLLLLLLGLGIVALLVWRAGPQLVLAMLIRLGWTFPAVVALYAMHLAVRAAALRRTIWRVPVKYTDALRIRLSGDVLERLTLTGPFLAEPTKGWLLRRQGLPGADAFAAIAAEYLLYTVVSACLAIVAMSLVLARGAVPSAFLPGALFALLLVIAFMVAFTFAAGTGVSLIVPILRASRLVIGARRATSAAQTFAPVERELVAFLHSHPARLMEVLAIETAAQLLLIAELWIVIPALGLPLGWPETIIVEGGAKFIAIVFAFIPGQLGASEGVYAWLAGSIGLPAAAGLTLALVRRMRGLAVAATVVVALASWDVSRRQPS